MKIISKYKDYYDYLSGIYGEDPKLVLDRRNSESCYIHEKIELYIAGYIIHGYRKNNKSYFGEELKQFHVDKNIWWKKLPKDYIYIPDDSHKGYWGLELSLKMFKDIENINEKYNCPVILKTNDFYKYPNLKELGLSHFLSPEEIYKMLSNYLAKQLDKKLEIKENLTNSQKIESKGFSKKTSFRPKMK